MPTPERRRRDYKPSVRPREPSPVAAIERTFQPPPQDPGGIGTYNSGGVVTSQSRTGFKSLASQIGDSTTVVAIIPAPVTYHIRLIYLSFFMGATAADEVFELYWGDAANLSAAPDDRKLYKNPLNSAFEEFTKTWGVGLGPPGPRNQQLSLRRSVGGTGTTLDWMVWYMLER